MKILWITNIILPPLCEHLGLHIPVVGGWMYSSLKRLKSLTSYSQYSVATVWQGRGFKKLDIDGITYYLLPLKGKSMTKYNSHLEALWRDVKNDFKPDIIHIHGSEYPHGLAYVRACGSEGVVVSIQGIISCIARYYTGNISHKEIKKSLTFRDFLRGGINDGQKDFVKRGNLEKELLRRVSHIIGRTNWDKAHTWAINPNATYHHVGETLRDPFYMHQWTYSKCVPHTIFVSQASYPIKGLHKLLEAMPLVLREYPDTKIYVAGYDESSKPWYRITGYSKYLRKLIQKNKLDDKVIFTGILDEQQICECYLSCNLFVCCSAIENSPNSLGESQMLGMPHLATFAGGIPEIVDYNPAVLYRFEETEMLAKKICEVFSLREKVKPLHFNSEMYDGSQNTDSLIEAYKQIISV